MRIDHLAFRVLNRHKAANFFCSALKYQKSTDFRVDFKDGTNAKCFVMTPPERKQWDSHLVLPWALKSPILGASSIYHQPPEVFISQGSPGSIVDRWVAENGNRLHHVALQVDNIEEVKNEWEDLGFAEFSSPEILQCPGLKQIFTKPSDLTGFIWELIEREPGEQGFCNENVKNLMLSSTERD